MPKLTEAEYRKTLRSPMRRATEADAGPVLDFWTYFEAIPPADFEGYTCRAGRVEYVWQTSDGQFEHILVDSAESRDMFMVIVVDCWQRIVVGHHLLDLPRLYAL